MNSSKLLKENGVVKNSFNFIDMQNKKPIEDKPVIDFYTCSHAVILKHFL